MATLPEISAAFPVLCLVSCFHGSLPNITRTSCQGCFHWQQPSLVALNLWMPEANEEASLNDLHRNDPIENHQRLTLNDMAWVVQILVKIFFVESVHEISAIQVVHLPWRCQVKFPHGTDVVQLFSDGNMRWWKALEKPLRHQNAIADCYSFFLGQSLWKKRHVVMGCTFETSIIYTFAMLLIPTWQPITSAVQICCSSEHWKHLKSNYRGMSLCVLQWHEFEYMLYYHMTWLSLWLLQLPAKRQECFLRLNNK